MTSLLRWPWRAWRRLRRMDTALFLLLAVSCAAAMATIVPQRPTAPEVTAAWEEGAAGPGAATASALDAFGLFDVLSTWWFATLVLLLLASLLGCLVERVRIFLREARRPPPPGHHLGELTHRAKLETAADVDSALERAAGVLARHRLRVRSIPAADAPAGRAQLAAERGRAREAASIVFHLSIVVLLAGAAVAVGGGFRGQVDIVEGERFAETALVYHQSVAGPRWSLGDHRGFVVGLDRFTATEHPDGTPADFLAEVTVDGAARELRVGHPLRVDGMTVHLARHGVAARVVVRARETLLSDQRVLLRQAGDLAWAGSATVRLGAAATALAGHPAEAVLDLVLVADAPRRGGGRVVGRSSDLQAPALLVNLHAGSLDGPLLAPTMTLETGQRAGVLDDLLVVELVEVDQWIGLQISRVPGRWLLLGGAGLLLTGLTMSLYAYRRRVWIEAEPIEGGSRLLIAGVARQRPWAFAAAWPRLVADLGRALVPGPVARTEQPAEDRAVRA